MSRRTGLWVVLAACALAFVLARGRRSVTPAGEPAGGREEAAAPGAAHVVVSGVSPLTRTKPPFPLVETFLAVHPLDSGNLLASAMSTSGTESIVFRSHDGGASWAVVAGPAGEVFPGGDPMVAFAGDGSAYFSTITPEIRVWRSVDGGRTWTGPVAVGPGKRADRQWVTASRAAGEGAPAIHAASKATITDNGQRRDLLMLSASRDGGVTFAEPRLIALDSGTLHTVTDLAVLRDGTVLVPLLVIYSRLPGDDDVYRSRRWILVSADDGTDWEGPYHVAENLQFGNENWDQAMKGLGGGGIAVDEGSGQHHGAVYMTWPAVIDGHLQIVLARSADGGRTWDRPVVVDGGAADSDQGTPTVAVNRAGVVVVTWNDRRDDRRGQCFLHYAAASTDGGRTFGPSLPVSDRRTCPGARSRWLNGGDTQGLVALPDGSFRTVWSVGRSRDLRPWTAVIHVR